MNDSSKCDGRVERAGLFPQRRPAPFLYVHTHIHPSDALRADGRFHHDPAVLVLTAITKTKNPEIMHAILGSTVVA